MSGGGVPPVGLYPGTFDPVTRGHEDLIARALAVVDTLWVGVATDTTKEPLFPLAERVEMAREATADEPRVRVEAFSGLTVEFARRIGARVILRGLRSPSIELDEDQRREILIELEGERARAQRALIEQLTSARYRQLMDRWNECLSQDLRGKPDDGCRATPLVTSVARCGERLYRRLLSRIEHVDSDTSVDELHHILGVASDLRDLLDELAAAGLI